MFNWFKRSNKKSSILNEWYIDGVSGFKIIQNPDSIQYVNEDSSKVIYFSALTIHGDNHSAVEANISKPTILKEANEWHIKGTKKSKNKMLVCVISVKNMKDIEWAKSFFDAIKQR